VFISHVSKIKGIVPAGDDLKGVVKKILIGPREGWEGHVMRLFILDPGGYTPRHTHPWEHVNIILKGRGKLFVDGNEYPLEEGTIAVVPENSLHQYMAYEEGPLHLICIVPTYGDSDY